MEIGLKSEDEGGEGRCDGGLVFNEEAGRAGSGKLPQEIEADEEKKEAGD